MTIAPFDERSEHRTDAAREARQASHITALRTLNELASRLWQMSSLQDGLDEMLAATIKMLGADFGNIQLFDPERGVLTIEVEHEVERPFLDYFREVSMTDGSACGRALRAGERIIVEDIETDADFAPMREVMRAADCKSVQATPLSGGDGTLLGMIITFWRTPYQPSELELDQLDLYARQAAGFIEHQRLNTARRENETHQTFLLELSDALRPLADSFAIKETAMRLLGQHLQANRALYWEAAEDHYVVEAGYCDGVPPIPRGHPIASYGSSLHETLRSASRPCDCDTQANPELSADERAWFAALEIGAHIGVPLIKSGELVAALAVHAAEPRAWSNAEIELTEAVAERTGAAIERARTEKALRQSEEQLRLACEATALGVYEWDPRTDAVTWKTDRMNEIFGRNRDEAPINATQFTQEMVHPDDAQSFEAALEEALQTDSFHFTGRFTRLDGALRWIELTGKIERGGDGEPLRMPGTAADITERKRAQVADAARLAAIVESSDDAIISKDLDGMIQTWNAAAQRLFGYTAEEAVGQSITLLIPADRVPEEEEILRRIRQGERIEQFETVRQCKDGALVDVSLTVSPLADEAGRITGASKIVRDVTARRRGERLREQQTRLLELIAAGTPLDNCLEALCSAVSRISRGVRASILMADAGQEAFQRPIAPELQASWGEGLTGAPINDLMSGTCGETVFHGRPVICEDITTDQRRSREWRELCEANGVLAGYSVPVWEENGQPVASFMLCFDRPREPSRGEQELARFGSHIASIALARNRAIEALRAADRRKDEFLATLAHELRNPLAPIRTGLEALKLVADDPAQREETRAVMERQVQQMARLIDDLLDVSRITRGNLELRTAHVELANVVQSAVEATRPYIDEADHELTVTLPPQPVLLEADPNRLAQVFSNLLNNAAKYTPAGGRIGLIAAIEPAAQAAQSAMVAVTVADNGIGIPAEKQTGIFEMFGQLDQSLEKGNQGLGLGLTLVKQLVELHGGAIEVHSEGEGKGTEFSVRLPIRTEPPAADSPPAQAETAAAGTKALRVLVVDDQTSSADMLAMVVKLQGYEVQTAYDGAQAVEVAAELRPDVVLMDLGMPRMNGYEAARQIRSQAWGQKMALVALSGWGQEADRQRTREAGFDHHLAKPAEPAAVQALLAELEPKSV